MVEIIDEIGRYSGCHRDPKRSFFYRGHQFPVCVRCTGVFFGQIFAVIINIFANVKASMSFIFLGVMGIDWLVQEVGIRQSTNKRRLITGFLGGFGLWSLYIIVGKAVYKKLKNKSNNDRGWLD